MQSKGCPTGLRPSGPLSRLVMGKWRKGMIDKAELCTALATNNPIKFSRLEFHALEKYVDDVFLTSNKLPKGTRWNKESGAMEWSQEQAENENMD